MADPRLATVPAGRLIDMPTIAEMLGVKRTTVEGWRIRDQRPRREAQPMPSPVIVASGRIPLWDRDEIKVWANITGRSIVNPRAGSVGAGS